jgi:hypothetical protein
MSAVPHHRAYHVRRLFAIGVARFAGSLRSARRVPRWEATVMGRTGLLLGTRFPFLTARLRGSADHINGRVFSVKSN